MSGPWIHELRAAMELASSKTVSSFAKLGERHQRTVALVDAVIKKLGHIADGRKQTNDPQKHERIIDTVKRRNYDALSVLDQRYAAKQFTNVTPFEMRRFLEALPNNWKTFAIECLKRWGKFDRSPDRVGYQQLLAEVPKSVEVAHRAVSPRELYSVDGPTLVSRVLGGEDLQSAREILERLGFESTWTLTANSLACWMYLRSTQPRTFSRAWQSVASDRILEAMLLPPLEAKKDSWFSDEPRPPRVLQNVEARATFVAALLRAARQGVDDRHWGAFVENLLQSDFGDPRIAFESKGWARVKARDPETYQRFLEQLITEDLTVFFDHAMSDKRRKRFWMHYLKSVRRTVCVLNRTVHKSLKNQLAGSDEKLAAAIGRARKFTSTTGAHAFCLYFDTIVVVEFSEQPNAAYVYDRGTFLKNFEESVISNKCKGPLALKSTSLKVDRIPHVGDWESTAEQMLASHRVFRN